MVSGGARAVARCDELGVAPYSDLPDQLFRGWLMPAFGKTQHRIAEWMVDAGMTVSLDAATNLVGRYDGANPCAPVLLIGSHIDSVRDAGRYDGPLGVMLGIECVAALHASGRHLPFPIEVIAFGDEEGSRFPASMLTSRAVAGTLEPAALNVVDGDGISFAEALARYRPPLSREGTALDVTGIGHAARRAGSVLAYLEAHIEQGPALEVDGLPVGIVTGIAAQLRYRLVIDGTAGHAGTTAMTLRHDALAAAAEIVLAVERIGSAGPADLVATVGRLRAIPGAPNVIPGHVDMTLDVRALDPVIRNAAATAILSDAQAITERRNLRLTIDQTQDLAASPCDPRLIELLAEAVIATGQPDRRLASGAGHDAMVMARLCPTAMLFIRCAGGISHNPAEQVDAADVDVALAVMLGFIDRLGETFDA